MEFLNSEPYYASKQIFNQSSDFPVRRTGSYRHKKSTGSVTYFFVLREPAELHGELESPVLGKCPLATEEHGRRHGDRDAHEDDHHRHDDADQRNLVFQPTHHCGLLSIRWVDPWVGLGRGYSVFGALG